MTLTTLFRGAIYPCVFAESRSAPGARTFQLCAQNVRVEPGSRWSNTRCAATIRRRLSEELAWTIVPPRQRVLARAIHHPRTLLHAGLRAERLPIVAETIKRLPANHALSFEDRKALCKEVKEIAAQLRGKDCPPIAVSIPKPLLTAPLFGNWQCFNPTKRIVF